MIDIKSAERTNKIERALTHRQPTLTVVLENIHDPHNVSAILRSCDAVGIMSVRLLYTIESFPDVANAASSSAHKWLDVVRYSSTKSCFDMLHSEGFRVYATRIAPQARSIYDLDMTAPTAIILGNEHRGVSDESTTMADETIYIPMMGMVESLNVSVAAAVTLFEAERQRIEAGMYAKPQLSSETLRSKRDEWLLR